MVKEYIAKADASKVKNIKEVLTVSWESRVMPGLIAIQSDKSVDEILKVDGIISCRESVQSTFNR